MRRGMYESRVHDPAKNQPPQEAKSACAAPCSTLRDKLADTPTPKPQEGTWTLTAPDGRTWSAPTPLLCCRAEQRERVPGDVGVARVLRALDMDV